MIGPVLFETTPLAAWLASRRDERAAELWPAALATRPFSKLQVRRGLMRAACFDQAITLGNEITVKTLSTRHGRQVQARIAFHGEGELFQAELDWPASRLLRGTVEGQDLVIAVQFTEDDEAMVPYAIASEILSIRRVLDAQNTFIAADNAEQQDKMRSFVEDHWQSLSEMHPYARARVVDIAAQWREDLLRFHDLVFGGGPFDLR